MFWAEGLAAFQGLDTVLSVFVSQLILAIRFAGLWCDYVWTIMA